MARGRDQVSDREPIFSVVIPTFNREKLLPRCLQSVLDQSFRDFEIVVADDGSNDGSRAIVDEHVRREPRLRYVFQENKGAGDARNLGAAEARGRYLTFLDSDDEVLPCWLEVLERELNRSDASIVCCGIAWHDSLGQCAQERIPEVLGEGLPPQQGHYRSGTFAIDRKVFEEIGGYASGLAANQHSELRCRLELAARHLGWTVSCLPDVLIRAHDHDGPKIRKNTYDVFRSAEFILTKYRSLMRENRQTYGNWASACAGAAAKSGRFRDARLWFGRALGAQPTRVRYYARYIVASIPGLRSYVWRKSPAEADSVSL